MKTIVKEDGITIELDINDDGSVNLQQKMKVSYADDRGHLIEKEMYPDVHVSKRQGAQKYGTIKNQFELVKASINFDRTYDKVTKFDRVTSVWIRENLEQFNVSQTELAAGVNVSPQQITMWLNGTRNPSGAAQAAIWYFFNDKVKHA